MVLAIGDLHMKDALGYNDAIKEGRHTEREAILDFIVKSAKGCDKVVFLGDLLNSRTNSPNTIRMLVNFIERFNGKEVYIIAGNHCKFADGRTALDFLAEIKNPKWHIITKEIVTIEGMTFLPWFFKNEKAKETNEKFIKGILKELPGGDILFHHFAVSGTKLASGMSVDLFNEPVFSQAELEKKYKLVVGGHIHLPSCNGNTIVTGSVFNNEVGENGKYIWTIDDKNKVKQIRLPGRGIYKLTDPTEEEIAMMEPDNIVKVVLTKKLALPKVEELKKKLAKFDAFLISEQIPHERKRMNYGSGEAITEFTIEQLLELYAKERSVDPEKLKFGFELIR